MTRAEPPPQPYQGDLHHLPAALASLTKLSNWVCWSWRWRVGKNGTGKWDKPPFQPSRPDTKACNNDPATWGTYEEALAVLGAGRCTGIGFNLLGTEYAAFDIDDCRDKDTGIIAAEAMAIVEEASSYTEVTVSGTGLRVIGLAKGARLHRRLKINGSPVGVETYRNAERYIVITGMPLSGTGPHLANIDDALDAVVKRLDPRSASQESRTDPGGHEEKFRALPEKLRRLIEDGVPPAEDRSAAFHHAVCWLNELGFSALEIEQVITGKPIVPLRFAGRLAGEIQRSLGKAKPHQDQTSWGKWGETRQTTGKPPLDLFWHGEAEDREVRSWLVGDLIPEKGHGLASGQWGAAKTFAMIDLCAAVMTGQPFAGREIVRRGGVLFVAAEGAHEIPIRLRGVVDHKIRTEKPTAPGVSPGKLPFAWIEEDPSLKDDMERIADAARSAATRMEVEFGLPLVLIVFDTLNAVGRFKDGNDAAEGQQVMNQLGALSKSTGAFVLAVDHFGKAVETGTRGSSAKEASADVVLAFLANRDIAGNISNKRMAVRKLRGGKTGEETRFELKVVPVGLADTTCVIEWGSEQTCEGARKPARDVWPRSTRILRAALLEVLQSEGRDVDPVGDRMMMVKVVAASSLRKEFTKRYVADVHDGKKEADAKRNAFNRAFRTAQERDLVGAREIDGIDHVWLVADAREQAG